MNWFERVNKVFNPEIETKVNDNQMNTGYASYDFAVYDGLMTSVSNDEIHTNYTRDALIAISRDLYRNNVIYQGLINRVCSYIIGEGYKIQIRNENDDNNNVELEKKWCKYWNKPEITNRYNGNTLEIAILKEYILTGEANIIILENGQLQLVECEQIIQIDYNEYNQIVQYTIAGYNKSGIPDKKKSIKVDAKNVVRMVNCERPSSQRGLPLLQASFPVLKRIEEVSKNEAKAWEILSRFVVSINMDNADSAKLPFAKTENNLTQNNSVNRIQEMGKAIVFRGKPGEKIEGINRGNIPRGDFDAVLSAFLRLVGLPLGIPLEIIMLDWTKSNYSQCRAILEQTYQNFRILQNNLKNSIYEPIIRRTLNLNESQNVDYFMPSWPWIDPYKEVQAYQQKLALGLTTYNDVCKQVSKDADETIAIRKREILKAIDTSKEIKETTGIDVPYQVFCGLDYRTESLNIDYTKDDKEDENN